MDGTVSQVEDKFISFSFFILTMVVWDCISQRWRSRFSPSRTGLKSKCIERDVGQHANLKYNTTAEFTSVLW